MPMKAKIPVTLMIRLNREVDSLERSLRAMAFGFGASVFVLGSGCAALGVLDSGCAVLGVLGSGCAVFGVLESGCAALGVLGSGCTI